jgi:hypothetical protein
MANYVRQTWTDAVSALSAARMGVIEQGIFDAHFQPAARVFHNTTQSITTATLTALAFNSERFDTDTIHDTVTNNSRLTCKTAGKYQITGNIEWAASPTTNAQIDIFLNASTQIARSVFALTVSADFRVMNVTTLYDLAVNDFVELRVFQQSGGSININSSGNYSPEFMMVRVG